MARRSTHHIALDCPAAPAALASAYTRTLRAACVLLGGIEALARHLDVPASFVRSWLEGAQAPPEPQFLGALELVLLHVSDTGRRN